MRSALALLVALFLAGCGSDGHDDPAPADLPLTYTHVYGGVAGGGAELRLTPDGHGSITGGPYGHGCGPEGETQVELSDDELARLRERLRSATAVSPRVVDEPATEAPSFRLSAERLELDYYGFDVVPDEAKPLFDELDHLVSNHCRRITP
jgi:hypothetical protein